MVKYCWSMILLTQKRYMIINVSNFLVVAILLIEGRNFLAIHTFLYFKICAITGRDN
jgi:hypothetical protein